MTGPTDFQGIVPPTETEGNWDPAETMLLLNRSGFTGFLLDDHVPHMDGDSSWNHRARAHAVGYMQGLINMMNVLDA